MLDRCLCTPSRGDEEDDLVFQGADVHVCAKAKECQYSNAISVVMERSVTVTMGPGVTGSVTELMDGNVEATQTATAPSATSEYCTQRMFVEIDSCIMFIQSL